MFTRALAGIEGAAVQIGSGILIFERSLMVVVQGWMHSPEAIWKIVYTSYF